MEDIKRWFTSKTVIASGLGVLITILQIAGVDQAAGIDKESLAAHVVDVVEGVLYAIALYGRLTAKQAIG